MEQENQRGKQRQRAAVEHAPRQQPDESAADEKEEMRQQTARKQNVARVFQPKRALEEYEGNFERRPVEPLVVESRLAFASGVEGESRFADVSLSPLVRTNPVIVEDGKPDRREQTQRQKRSASRQKRDGELRKRGRRHDVKCAPNAASILFRGPSGARFGAFEDCEGVPPPRYSGRSGRAATA